MVVHRTALWVLLSCSSVIGAAWSLRHELNTPRSDRRVPPIERYVVGALTGVGVGMGVATLVLLAAAVVVRLGP